MDNFEQEPSWLERNKTVFIVLGGFLIVAIVIVLIFLAMRLIGASKNNPNQPAAPAATSSTAAVPTPAASSSLPTANIATSTANAAGGTTVQTAAEKLNFSDFYQAPAPVAGINPANYPLPINVKTDVANYYDINRKLSLDAGLNALNQDGFVVLDNAWSADADNFYKMYDLLDAKQVPTLITSDFLLYYYQNVLKLAYQDIESSVFYDNIWDTDKKLYQAAKDRYESNLAKQGLINDVSLEGSRLELAYFATALSLLAPTDNQIAGSSGLGGTAGFSTDEANRFSFQLPAYLQDDVGNELKFIRAAAQTAKSPIFLYQRDYREFAVPTSFTGNARLNNFYLASKWLNSVFPLYHQDANCPNCLLDINDWRINMYAAFLISDDLAADQVLKNNWAKIYKLQGFFDSLRGDLNYLYYQQALQQDFGANVKSTDVLVGNDDELDKKLTQLQSTLAGFDFPAIQGGLSKTATGTKPLLGMKMLVDTYSPDNYLAGALIYPQVGAYQGPEKDPNKVPTACRPPEQTAFDRCFAIADDIANLFYPLNSLSIADYLANSLYQNYAGQMAALSKQWQEFTVGARHNFNYWTILDVAEKLMTAPEKKNIIFMESAAWQKKDLNTALAAWVNGELPADQFVAHEDQSVQLLNQQADNNPYSNYKYIEPNLTLSQELAANTEMISGMLTALGVGDNQNTVLDDLKSLESNLKTVDSIITKELNNQALSDADYEFINNFTREFSVKATGGKILTISSPYGSGFTENISGVKLLVLTYQLGDKKLFVIGPVFNYREEKK